MTNEQKTAIFQVVMDERMHYFRCVTLELPQDTIDFALTRWAGMYTIIQTLGLASEYSRFCTSHPEYVRLFDRYVAIACPLAAPSEDAQGPEDADPPCTPVEP